MAKELTDAQRENLIEQFVEIVVDNMDTKHWYNMLPMTLYISMKINVMM